MMQRKTTALSAAEIRRRGRAILDGGGGQRLTLILAVITGLAAAVGVFVLGEMVYISGYLIFGSQLWLTVAYYAVMGVAGVFGLLPLLVGIYRPACLAYPPRDNGVILPSLTHSPEKTSGQFPALTEIFHPFTSWRAYGRSLAVGLEILGWFAGMIAIPVAGYRYLTILWDYLTAAGYLPEGFQGLLTSLTMLGCISFGVLALFLSGYRAGFAYLAIVHEDLPLGEVNRYFGGFRRSFVRPFALRLSFAGWVAVSIVGILVPFVAHTIPYLLCCGAVYGAELERK